MASTKDVLFDTNPQAARSNRQWPKTLALFVLVAVCQFAFGMWMNSKGFVFIDAYSRATSALLVLHGADPHLAAIGFVWMPLPTLIELLWVAYYPLWPAIVSSGFASTLTTALAGGATAVLLLNTARRLGVNSKVAWAYALVIAFNPMLFFYGGNGLSEGVVAPFLTGAVCALVLFWHTRQRRYIALSGFGLALGVASLYEAIPFGGALFAAVVLGAIWGGGKSLPGSRADSAPGDAFEDAIAHIRKHWRTAESQGILIITPSIYVLVLWLAANAFIMRDPLFFATSAYSNYGQTAAVGGGGLARQASGDVLKTLGYVLQRAFPFLIPGATLLVIRAAEGRLWRINTLSLVLLLLSVPFGLIAPLIYLKDSFGWLRFFMYPLFVAAAWGLYEISQSQRRRVAVGVILAGWVIAAPVILAAMADPGLGQEEHWEMQSLQTGQTAEQIVQVNQKGEVTRFPNWLGELQPVAAYLDNQVFAKGETVAVDAFQGSAIAAQVHPDYLSHLLILTQDRQFKPIIEHPQQYHVSYLLVPNSINVPQDAINRTYPALWAGHQPGFVLAKSFPNTPQQWRLYRVTPGGRATSVTRRDSFQLSQHHASDLVASSNLALNSTGAYRRIRGHRDKPSAIASNSGKGTQGDYIRGRSRDDLRGLPPSR